MHEHEQTTAPAGNDVYQHVVVFVHGTFARGASWTHPDSPLATTIANALDGRTLLTPFEWSGRNSHEARLLAGAELAEQLGWLKDSYPAASLHVVAHSHGGNVVAYALRSPDIRDSVKSIICLGTPFISAHSRDLASTRRLLTVASVAASVFVAFLCAYVLLNFVIMRAEISDNTGFLDSMIALLLFAGGALLFLAVWLFIRLSQYVDTKAVPRLTNLQEEIVTSLQGQFGHVQMLNIQTRRDEAAGYLRVVRRIAEIPFQLWSPRVVFWVTVPVTSIFVVAMAFFLYADMEPGFWLGPILALIVAYLISIFAVVVVLVCVTLVAVGLCAVWPRIFRAHALGFGEEGFTKNWLVDISASSQPSNAKRSHDEMVNTSGHGLHHSLLYQDKRVLKAIATWMSAFANLPQRI